MIKDNILLFGTDEYDKIQAIYQDWSYGLHRKKKRKSGNSLINEYEEEIIDKNDNK